MRIRIWKPGEKGILAPSITPSSFYARSAIEEFWKLVTSNKQSKPRKRFGTMSGIRSMILSHLHLNKFCLATL